jgi:hypothetical protein
MEIEISEDGFINALRSQNGGALIEELDRELAKAVQAIFDHKGGAEITLKLKIERLPRMENALEITPAVAVKLPKEERPSKVMWVTAGSGLTDQYQEQQSMDLGSPVQPQKATLTPVSKINGDKP